MIYHIRSDELRARVKNVSLLQFIDHSCETFSDNFLFFLFASLVRLSYVFWSN